MKLKRLEVRLRPKNPVEQELIEALGAQDGIYGGKNELLRECLGRGYTLLKQRMESLSGIEDEVTMLHTLAQTFASGEYGGYRVVKIYLDAHGRAAAPVQPETQSPPTRTDKPERKSDDSLEGVQQVVKSALDAVAAEGTPVIATAQTNQPESPPAPADAARPAGAAKRTVDWSQMRGLAGSVEKKELKNTLAALIEAAISGDVLTGEGGGFVSIMGKSSRRRVQQDIPAAFEAYTLLSRFLGSLPLRPIALDAAHPITDLSPTIFHDEAAARIVALLPIGTGELAEVAYWLTDSLCSDQVKQMSGILALPFSIENHAGVEHLLPEWFAAFYLRGEPEHCIPILTLRSVLADPRFGGDWVSVALERMTAFALPQEQAVSAVRSQINTS